MTDMQVSGKHRRTLEEIYAHPISSNINFKKVVGLFEDLGGEVTDTKQGHVKVKLAGNEMSFARPHEGNLQSSDEVLQIRAFLEQCGIKPDPS